MNQIKSTIYLSSEQWSQLATILVHAAVQQGEVYFHCARLESSFPLIVSTHRGDMCLGTFSFLHSPSTRRSKSVGGRRTRRSSKSSGA